MARRLVIVGALALVLAGSLAMIFRKELILLVISRAAKVEIAATTPVIGWQKGPSDATPTATPRPPNIVFILADDLGLNDITAFGGGVAGGVVPTPNIDRIASEGAYFSNAYAGNSTCAPSRAMLMTGRYPSRTGFEFTPNLGGMTRILSMFTNDHLDKQNSPLPRSIWDREIAAQTPPYDEQGLPGAEVTIAELLQSQGYYTAHVGKWHLGRGDEFGPNAQGFDDSLLLHSALYYPIGDPRSVEARLDFDSIDRFLWAAMQFGTSFNGGEPFEPSTYLTDYLTDEALHVIEENKNRPFFLYLAHWAPHTPLQATTEDYEAVGDIEPHRLRTYAAMIRALDRNVGKVLDTLDEEGLTDNTIVIFSSDNGGAGYIGIPDVNQPFRGWKSTFFEGGIRVPLFLRWPAQVQPGTVIDTPVAHIDVMPTLAEMGGAGLPVGIEIDGRSLMPALLEGEIIRDKTDALYWKSGGYSAIRRGDWKLQRDGVQGREWLFNLADDPTEQKDLIEREPTMAAELAAMLDDHLASSRPPLYPNSLTAAVTVDKTKADVINEGDTFIFWQN
ncbi:MAG: sulfatase [Pseudomonadota bacterium]